MKTDIKYALVTGASKGLGYAYCEQLLKLNYNVIGVARDTSSLKKLQEKYLNLDVQAWNFDLSLIENNQMVFKKAQEFNVELLINNAGFGVWGTFCETDLGKELNMIELNIKSLHILTKLFVKKFVDQNRGRIINISSIAAYSPGPVFSSYFASKSYVSSLGIAINTELKKTKSKVRVVTICPGPLKTEFWNRSSYQKGSKKLQKIKGLNVEKFCKKSLSKSINAKNKNTIVIGNANKILVLFMKKVPQCIVLNKIYKIQSNK